MFKRLNKITSLLVLASAVISLVPSSVNAADIKRFESEDGTIYKAVAYKDGKFYIDGEVNGKDEENYYLQNGKFTELENIGAQDEYKLYGDKYIDFENEDYYLDLSSGKETDAELEEDDTDNAATNLRKKVKNDNNGRYTDDDAKDVRTLKEIPGNKFANPYYVTQYTAKSKSNNGPSEFNVLTDGKGTYVDADHLIGKFKVTLSDNSKATLENTNGEKNGVTASVRPDESYGEYGVIAQDKSYVYRIADINFTSPKEIKEIDGVSVKGSKQEDMAFNLIQNTTTSSSVEFKVIQKISKEQSSNDISGAITPKSVSSYVISNNSGKKKALLGNGQDSKFTVADGKLINYLVSADSIQAKKITLKSEKSYGFTDVSDGGTLDLDNNKYGFDIDVDGNLWGVDRGSIYKFNNDSDWEKIYKVDGSFDKLSVYDKNNIVSWNEGDGVYSIIAAKEEVKEPETPVVTKGWVQSTDGTWTYVKEDGTKAIGWVNLNGAWYYLKADGIMATSWVNLNGVWYYLKTDGAMATGWVNDNGIWYYLNESGAMLSNTTINGYVLGDNGAWIQ